MNIKHILLASTSVLALAVASCGDNADRFSDENEVVQVHNDNAPEQNCVTNVGEQIDC